MALNAGHLNVMNNDAIEQIKKLEESLSKRAIISQSLLTAVLVGLAFVLTRIWLYGWNWRIAIVDGISWSLMILITCPAMNNYFGRAKISELRRGQFDWKDYYHPVWPLLILILSIAIALPAKVAIVSCYR